MTSAVITCQARVIGGIAFTTTSAGVISPAGLECACAQTLEQLSGYVPSLYVADFRRSTWQMSIVQLDAMFDGVDPAFERPAALVVRPDDFAMFRAHAWNVAQGGILRRVFTDYPQAVAWAQRRAGLVSPVRTVP